MLYGRARKLDLSRLTSHAGAAARRPADTIVLWQQARQARNEWRRLRYSRLIASEWPGFLKTFLFSRPAAR